MAACIRSAMWLFNFVNQIKSEKNINGEAFNFGPNHSQDKSVISLLKEAKKSWKNVEWKIKQNKNKFYESKLLKLNSNKAKQKLGWKPILKFERSVKLITDWYKNFLINKKNNTFEFSKSQINEYSNKLEKLIKKK